MVKIGLLFDIDKLGGGLYGQEALKILFKATTYGHLAGSSLYCGDVDIPIPGAQRPYCFCINIINLNDSLYFQELHNELIRIEHPSLPTGEERFYYGQHNLIHVANVSMNEVITTEYGQWVANVAKELK